MKREQLSKVIENIDEELIAEAYQFNPSKCSESPERIVDMKKKLITIAIAAATICALGAGAYAYYNWQIKDLVINSSQTENIQVPGSSGSTETNRADFISLQGYSNTAEYKAMKAWSEFERNYDKDGKILEKVGNSATKWDEKYNQNGYLIYSQEMADKMDEIAKEYGLKLHSGGIHPAGSMDEMYKKFGNFSKAADYAGYYFDDGTFQCDCKYNGMDYQIRRTIKGTLDTVGLNINDAEQYEQWEYKTASGVTVLLATGPDKAMIIADLKGSFVTVNVVTNGKNASANAASADGSEIPEGEDPYTYDDGEKARANSSAGSFVSKADLEALADTFDFSIL